MITAQTKLCGLIGDPVAHSLSPAMHNAAFAALGLDYVYLAFRVARAELPHALNGFRAFGGRGLNVTIPHKVEVIALLDGLDALAGQIGAVNTIVAEGGRLTGYNTDAPGFLAALSGAGYDPQGKRVVLLGAGGAARAVAFALAGLAGAMTILNRASSLKRAEELAASLRLAGQAAEVQELSEAHLRAALAQADLLVNATSVGMSPQAEETPVPAVLLRPPLTVFDLVYTPLRTRLLREAEAAGCPTIGGLAMLVAQGAASFGLWTGVKPDMSIMRAAALTALGKTSSSAPKTSVALIGFMGSGKTAVGRALALRLHKELVETDQLLRAESGKSIPCLFRAEGEPAFRQREAKLIQRVAGEPNQVIACGGGVVLDPANILVLKRQAVVVYLRATPEVVLRRVGESRHRPLLNTPDRAETVTKLMAARAPLYEAAADITVDTGRQGVKAMAELIISQLEKYEGFRF